jgi:undecaprenyl-diphosphatase
LTLLEAAILGAVQGLTEFLPVSSSGHLVIFQHIFNLQEESLTFDVLVHLGTLVAVIIAFFKDIVSILKKPFSKLPYLVIVGTIPGALIGYFFEPLFERAFQSLLVVGLGLIFTGIILRYAEHLADNNFYFKRENETSYTTALCIGLFQALAILPGISRSGSTIAAGLAFGLDREFAARFSFLLSIPIILGAGVFQLQELMYTGIAEYYVTPYLVGLFSAIIFGLVAIKVVMNLVRRGRLSMFSYYCWAVAVLVLAYYSLF